jgi:hypothetical protein
MLSSIAVRDDGEQEYALGAQHRAAEDGATTVPRAWRGVARGGNVGGRNYGGVRGEVGRDHAGI